MVTIQQFYNPFIFIMETYVLCAPLYICILLIILAEQPYDSIPNFTAADALRLTGVGRNEFIDIMNKCRSKVVSILMAFCTLPPALTLKTVNCFQIVHCLTSGVICYTLKQYWTIWKLARNNKNIGIMDIT